MIRAVCLDLGETLVEHHPPSCRVLGTFLRELGIDLAEVAIRRAYLATDSWYYLRMLVQTGRRRTPEERQALIGEYERRLLAGLGLAGRPEVGPAELRALFARTPHAYVPFPDTLPALRALRARGLRLAIVSNWDHSLLDRCRDLGLVEHFDAVVGSATVGVDKPDPAIFDLALRRLGVRPAEAWHVGDVYLTDILGARAAGVTPVLLDRFDLQPEVDCRRIRGLAELVELIDDQVDRAD